MADTFGAIEIPVADDATPIGDPALLKLGNYLAAVLNSKLAAAWVAARPRTGDAALPARKVLTHDPRKRAFTSEDLPALFVFRTKATFARDAADYDQDHANVAVWWIYPPDPQAKQKLVDQVVNAVGKIVRWALERERDSSWFDTGDTDVAAVSYAADADSIVLASATSLASVTYSGAGLNGLIGAATMAPRREVRITTSETDDPAYNVGVLGTVVVTGVNWNGRTKTWRLPLVSATGGDSIGTNEEIASVTSVAIPAMLSTDGSIQIGTSAVVGHGSHLHERCGFSRCKCTGATPTVLTINVLDGHGKKTDEMSYDAVEMTLDVVERFDFDPSADQFIGEIDDEDPAGPGLDINLLESDGDGIFESAAFPVIP